MTPDTLKFLYEILGQVRVSPMQLDAEQLLQRLLTAKRELEGELANGTVRTEG